MVGMDGISLALLHLSDSEVVSWNSLSLLILQPFVIREFRYLPILYLVC